MNTVVAILESEQSTAFNNNSSQHRRANEMGRLVRLSLNSPTSLFALRETLQHSSELLHPHAFEFLAKSNDRTNRLVPYLADERATINLSALRGSHNQKMYVRFVDATCPRYCGCELELPSTPNLGNMHLSATPVTPAASAAQQQSQPPLRPSTQGRRLQSPLGVPMTPRDQQRHFGRTYRFGAASPSMLAAQMIRVTERFEGIVPRNIRMLVIADIHNVVPALLDFFVGFDNKEFRVTYQALDGQDAGGVTRDVFTRFFAQLRDFKIAGKFPIITEQGTINFDPTVPIEFYDAFGSLGNIFCQAVKKDISLPSWLNVEWFKGLIILFRVNFFATLSHKFLLNMDAQDKAFFIHELTPTTNMMLYQWFTQGDMHESAKMYEDCKDLGPYVLSFLNGVDVFDDHIDKLAYWSIFDNYVTRMPVLHSFVTGFFGNVANVSPLKNPVTAIIEDKYPDMDDIVKRMFQSDFINAEELGKKVIVSVTFMHQQGVGLVARYKGFFKQFFEDCTQHELKQFLVFATGQAAPSRCIVVELKRNLHHEDLPEPYNRLPIAHTCSYTIDMFGSYVDYAMFKNDLVASIGSIHYGFQLQ